MRGGFLEPAQMEPAVHIDHLACRERQVSFGDGYHGAPYIIRLAPALDRRQTLAD